MRRSLVVAMSICLPICNCARPLEPFGCDAGHWETASEAMPAVSDSRLAPMSTRASVQTSGVMVEKTDRSRVEPPTEPSGPRRVDFKPGIILNYAKLQVEVQSQVILRRGELELFAWSKAPVPKEHETILVVDAKPSDVYAALGLIGLTPGTPPRFDAESGRPIPATGDRVDVFVRYTKGGSEIEHSICDWAIDKSREKPLARRPWVFCGSHRTENGAFAADIEGTLVTVVDFPTSLLSLAETHSDSNADLWLVANRDAIPEEGTPVTLILRPFEAAD